MIELAGQVAKERDLQSYRGFPQLVEVFKERGAELNNPQLHLPDISPNTYDEYMEGVEGEREMIIKATGELMSEVPLFSQSEDMYLASRELVKRFLSSELDLKYDRISPELFKLERFVFCDVEGGGYGASIPLFASVDLGAKRCEYTIEDLKSNRLVEIKINAPPITREAKQKAREFASDYLRVLSKGISAPFVGDFILRDLRSDDSNLDKSDMEVYWIPTPENLEIKVTRIVKDPLLVGKLYDLNYLVAMWDVEGEVPYQHYLEEFMDRCK